MSGKLNRTAGAVAPAVFVIYEGINDFRWLTQTLVFLLFIGMFFLFLFGEFFVFLLCFLDLFRLVDDGLILIEVSETFDVHKSSQGFLVVHQTLESIVVSIDEQSRLPSSRKQCSWFFRMVILAIIALLDCFRIQINSSSLAKVS